MHFSVSFFSQILKVDDFLSVFFEELLIHLLDVVSIAVSFFFVFVFRQS